MHIAYYQYVRDEYLRTGPLRTLSLPEDSLFTSPVVDQCIRSSVAGL